jgi:Transglycosylase/Domain of Unknown Function (DUF748)
MWVNGTTSNRRWVMLGATSAGLCAALMIAVFVIYPRVGEAKLASELDRLGDRLGRSIKAEHLDVGFGWAKVRGLVVTGPDDGAAPLVRVEEIRVKFRGWRSLVGAVAIDRVEVNGVAVAVRRDVRGLDNFSDLVAKLRDDGANGANGATGTSGGSGRSRSLRPKVAKLSGMKISFEDDSTGVRGKVADISGQWTGGDVTGLISGIEASAATGQQLRLGTISVKKGKATRALIELAAGDAALWPKMVLSGISGTVIPQEGAGKYRLAVDGGYGGVAGKLWKATGEIDVPSGKASLEVSADQFNLDKLEPILAHSYLVDYAKTSVDANLRVDVDRQNVTFSGGLHVRDLSVGHPMLADREVRHLDISGNVAGTVQRDRRIATLTRGDFVARGLPFSITGEVAMRGGRDDAPPAGVTGEAIAEEEPMGESRRERRRRAKAKEERDERDTREALEAEGDGADKPAVPPSAPSAPGVAGVAGVAGIESSTVLRSESRVSARLVIPPISCQAVLDSIPPEMVPYMVGYKMKGTFSTDLQLAIDFAHLDDVVLDGSVGIKNCKVKEQPEASPKRLLESFEHFVEVDKDQWISFIVGPENPDFVPYEDISPNLVNSIMTTEDSGFMKHHGFIVSEFRSALIKNLKAGYFRYGASSITMQLVKNVLLYREKTLSRKLQELFFTWDVENSLEKERILEIYFNVIEYGPGLYGIGPAVQHFFGKTPKELTPVEAAFFSSILPAPKQRYQQYCKGTLTQWTSDKIARILGLMFKRGRLTEEEYQTALDTPLHFLRDGSETEDECLARRARAIKKARPTNPMKQ